jgi:NTE family protein
MSVSSRILRHGLVLTGGGARAAYQVGVLRGLSHVTRFERIPFQIISGFSAGAINGTWLASQCHNFEKATESMWNEWASLTTDAVYRTDLASLSKTALRWLRDRSMGGLEKGNQITYLLDTAPLHHFIRTRIDFAALNENLRKGDLHAFSVTAANYHTGQSTAFFQGHTSIRGWQRLNRRSVRTPIQAEHVLASSSLPIFFPPVRVGESYYGDGMIRLNAPLSAPIHLGSDRLFVIGIRGPSSTSRNRTQPNETISLSEIAGTILNGLFFDALDADLVRMERINRTLSVMTPQELEKQPDHLRSIPLFCIRPSIEIEELLTYEISQVPATLRFLLKGIGLTDYKGMDLLSYLLFEPKYIRSLLHLGYEDALSQKDRILEFFGALSAENSQQISSRLL